MAQVLPAVVLRTLRLPRSKNSCNMMKIAQDPLGDLKGVSTPADSASQVIDSQPSNEYYSVTKHMNHVISERIVCLTGTVMIMYNSVLYLRVRGMGMGTSLSRTEPYNRRNHQHCQVR